MSEPYTSLETSLRLKQAGAPQKDGEKWASAYWWVDPEDPTPPQMCQYPHKTSSRAFRADEIIEALGGRLDYIRRSDNGGDWTIHVVKKRCRITVDEYDGPSLVEALAAAWLAVLEAK